MAMLFDISTRNMGFSNQLSAVSGGLISSAEKLTSGLRVNRSADDAAGLAIATGLSSQIIAKGVIDSGIESGINLLNTVDHSLQHITDVVQESRVRLLQAVNGTLSDSNRRQIQAEIQQLGKTVQDSVIAADFNKLTPLLEKQTLSIPTTHLLNTEIDLEFVSFDQSVFGSHYVAAEPNYPVAAQTLTLTSDYYDDVQIEIDEGDEAHEIIAKFNNSVAEINAEARLVNEREVLVPHTIYSRSLSVPSAGGSASFSVSEPDYALSATIAPIDGDTSTKAYVDSLAAFVADIEASPSEHNVAVSISPISSVSSYPATTYASSVPSQTLTLTGYEGQGSVSVPLVDKDNLNLSSVVTDVTAAATGVQATLSSGSFSLSASPGGTVDFDITAMNKGTATISQTIRSTVTRDGNGVPDTNADWMSLASKIQSFGLSVTLVVGDYWSSWDGANKIDSATTYETLQPYQEYTGLRISTPSQSAIHIKSNGGGWSMPSGQEAIELPNIRFTDTSGQSPAAFRVEASPANATSLVSSPSSTQFSSIRVSANDEPFNLNGAVAAQTGTYNEVVIDGDISFDAWHDFEISTTDASGSLLSAAPSLSHTRLFKDLDVVDFPGEFNTMMQVVKNSLQRVEVQRVENGAKTNALESAQKAFAINTMNVEQFRSQILDTDYAKETARHALNSILQDSTRAMLAQSNDQYDAIVAHLIDPLTQ